jgi:ABC-type dipeptide/oligopeptide/nickel transport system ATPase component
MLLEVRDLYVYLKLFQTNINVVDGVGFSIDRGMVFGLVGESGAGKTMTGKAIMRLVPEPLKMSGKLFYKGVDLMQLSEVEMRKIRGKEITAIQQDPVASLNPAFKIKDQIKDIIKLHMDLTNRGAEDRAVQMLKAVGIADPEVVMRSYPHQLSGGMCQRVMIAIAFSCHPSLVIADEPTTNLDVITQATVIGLMKKMKQEFDTSILFITHNLGLAAKICDIIGVMKDGKLLEVNETDELIKHPEHSYTRLLLEKAPRKASTPVHGLHLGGG